MEWPFWRAWILGATTFMLHAEPFVENPGHGREGQPFREAAELVPEPADLLAQLFQLTVGLFALPLILSLELRGFPLIHSD
jgi:hypothetical protein